MKRVRDEQSEVWRGFPATAANNKYSVKRHAFAPIMGLHPIVIEMPAARKTVNSVSPINRARRSFLMACEGGPVAR